MAANAHIITKHATRKDERNTQDDSEEDAEDREAEKRYHRGEDLYALTHHEAHKRLRTLC
eukprot:3289923-Rhodomonas_salina.1